MLEEKCCSLLKSDVLGSSSLLLGFWSDSARREKPSRLSHEGPEPEPHLLAYVNQEMWPQNSDCQHFLTLRFCSNFQILWKESDSHNAIWSLQDPISIPHGLQNSSLRAFKGRKMKCWILQGRQLCGAAEGSAGWGTLTFPSLFCYHWQLHGGHLGGKMGLSSALWAKYKSSIICIQLIWHLSLLNRGYAIYCCAISISQNTN